MPSSNRRDARSVHRAEGVAAAVEAGDTDRSVLPGLGDARGAERRRSDEDARRRSRRAVLPDDLDEQGALLAEHDHEQLPLGHAPLRHLFEPGRARDRRCTAPRRGDPHSRDRRRSCARRQETDRIRGPRSPLPPSARPARPSPRRRACARGRARGRAAAPPRRRRPSAMRARARAPRRRSSARPAAAPGASPGLLDPTRPRRRRAHDRRGWRTPGHARRRSGRCPRRPAQAATNDDVEDPIAARDLLRHRGRDQLHDGRAERRPRPARHEDEADERKQNGAEAREHRDAGNESTTEVRPEASVMSPRPAVLLLFQGGAIEHAREWARCARARVRARGGVRDRAASRDGRRSGDRRRRQCW